MSLWRDIRKNTNCYCQNNQIRSNQIPTVRAFLLFYGRYNRPDVLAIYRIVKNFKPTFVLHNVQVPTRQ